MAVLRRIINRIRSQREEGEVQATNVARYDLDVVEVQSSIIADLAEVNRLLLEELEKGKVYCKDTKECYDGVNLVAVKSEAFRAYDSWEESVTDHSAFLKANKRYKEVIGETDYKKACNAIKAAGYATDPEYANKLIEIIEQYKLTEFDGKTESQENQGAGAAGADAGKYYRVQAGAYRRKEGANLMAEQIKKTGHTDVFVRLLNGLYKVQVGAYTKKENAEATVKRLKAAGIVCFITHA